MIKSYFLTALRNLYKEKMYAAINILGLGIAIASCVTIGLYLRAELSYDKHNIDHERIVQLVHDLVVNGESNPSAATGPFLGPLFQSRYPETGEYVRFQAIGRSVFRNQDRSLYWDEVYFADPNVFDIFTHEALYGSLQDSLQEPDAMVISESFARSFFGDVNPIGQTLSTDTYQYQVTAVFKDLPANTHFKYNALLSRKLIERDSQAFLDGATPFGLFGTYIYTYMKVPDVQDVKSLAPKLNDFFDQFAAAALAEQNFSIRYEVLPLAKTHYDNYWQSPLARGNTFYLYGLAIVGLFILLVACINYTNLSIARATRRIREVGMRKLMGAERQQLMIGFLCESLLYSICALVLGFFLVELVGTITSGSVLAIIFSDMSLFLSLLAFTLLISLLSGAYPAFYLSSYSAQSALVVAKRNSNSNFTLNQLLVLLQFSVSIAVISSVVLMSGQLRFIDKLALGFERDSLLAVTLQGADSIEQLPTIKERLLQQPAVLGVAKSSFTLDSGEQGFPDIAAGVENNEGVKEIQSLVDYFVGEDFLQVMGLELSQGRDFSTDFGNEEGTALIVNEALVRKMNWDQALGKQIDVDGRVIGVIKDFHFDSLHQEVIPMVMRLAPATDFSDFSPVARTLSRQTLFIKLAESNSSAALGQIESVITEFDSTHPFEYRFFNDAIDSYYRSETSLVNLIAVFAGICVFISIMGMFGLMALNTKLRSHEIGIRKVLGATTSQIIKLFAHKQVLMLVGAGVIASCASYLVVSEWLLSFAYRLDINLWVFLASTLAVGLVAIFTVSIHAALTANLDPVLTLRHE